MNPTFRACVFALAMTWVCAVLGPVALAAQDPAPRIPRDPPPQPPTRTLTIQGDWGYPCALDFRCGFLPGERWQPLEVAAWVGTSRFVGGFTGVPDERGLFEVTVQVPPQQRGDMVLVEVLAQSPQGHTARFESLQDTAGRLLEEAGPGGRVGGTGPRPNQVTILSTALVGLLRDGNGGDWRMGEARLFELLHQVDPARLMRHAQVFQGINLGQLPGTGELDANALIASAAAVDAYLADVPQATLDLLYDTFSSGGQTAFQEVDFAALDVTMLPAAAPGTVAFGRRAGVRMRMDDEWSQGGFMSSIIDTGRANGVGAMFLLNTDSFPRSARVVRPGNPSVEAQRIDIDCPGSGLVQALRISSRTPSMFRRMAMAGGLEFVELTESRALQYRLNAGVDPACLAGLPTFDAGPGFHLAHPTRFRGRARDTLQIRRATMALQLLNPDPDPGEEDSRFIAGTVDLAAGQVDAPGYAPEAVVDFGADGVLRLALQTLPGSLHEGVVDVRIEPVRGDGLGAEEWMVSSRLRFSADDHLRAHVTPAVRVDPALALTPALLEGSWQSGADLSVPDRVAVLTLEIDAGGQGVEVLPEGSQVPFSWRLEAGQWVASTYARASQPDVWLPACPVDADDCDEVRRRVWVPLRLATRPGLQRLYVIEDILRDDGEGLRRASRQLNFYDAR